MFAEDQLPLQQLTDAAPGKLERTNSIYPQSIDVTCHKLLKKVKDNATTRHLRLLHLTTGQFRTHENWCSACLPGVARNREHFCDQSTCLTRFLSKFASAKSTMPPFMKFHGSNCFRQRLALSTLTLQPIIISEIRSNEEEPGLTEAEISLLKLIEKVTNGSTVEVDETGTEVTYKPGILVGGEVEHDCGLDRSIGYFVELLMYLAPFCKTPLNCTLKGITNDNLDPSIECLNTSCRSIMKKFLNCLDDHEIVLKIMSRGLKPRGGGIVSFKCPIRRVLKPIQITDPGKIKRIRGVAFSCRVSPQMSNRMVDEAKGALLSFLPDVYIHTEHHHGSKSGLSPGYGLVLYAETTNGTFYCGECVNKVPGPDCEAPTPENVAKEAVQDLLEEVYRGGCVDSRCQGLTLLFMALCEADLSKLKTGPLSPYTIQLLRHMKEFLHITFKLDSVENKNRTGSNKVVATCIGVGYSNLSKKVS